MEAEPSGDDVRDMLRDSLRGFLAAQWSADCVKRGPAAPEIAAIWHKLVGQGVAGIGSHPDEGGLREAAVVLGELGRAACPAPMWSAVLANLALSTAQSDTAVELLKALHAGRARVAFSFGVLDPDSGAGMIRVSGDHADGLLRFVEAAASCTHLLVAIDRSTLGLVALDGAGVEIVPARAMGAWGFHEVRLNAASVARVALHDGVLDDLLIKARLALTARAHGAARRAFELVADYARERYQFGQPIGRFQAIQHKLANGLIALEGVRLMVGHGGQAARSRRSPLAAFCQLRGRVRQRGAAAGIARDPSRLRCHRLCRRA